jgi:hypothetical protein
MGSVRWVKRRRSRFAREDMSMGDPTDPPHTTPKQLDRAQLDPGTLYAVLSYRGDLAAWDWSFFVPDPSKLPIGSCGTIFHVVPDAATSEWKLHVETQDIIAWPLVVAVVRLADVNFLGAYDDLVGKDSLLPIFKTVAIPERTVEKRQWSEFSSRLWFLDAVFALHDCGVLQCDDLWLLERELKKCAFQAMDGYLENRGESFLSL